MWASAPPSHQPDEAAPLRRVAGRPGGSVSPTAPLLSSARQIGLALPGRFTGLTPIAVTATGDPLVLEADFTITSAPHTGTGSRRDKVAVIRTRAGHPLVPASTWKGLFRARAGYITRTCWGEGAACTQQAGCGHCPVCDLFGSATKRGRLNFRRCSPLDFGR